MNIALISDIHGNAIALEAVLEDIKAHNIDHIYCLGDVATLGPEPEMTIEILRREKIPCIMGNHDEFLIDASLIEHYTKIPVIRDAVSWCRKKLNEDMLTYISDFSRKVELSFSPQVNALYYHGSPKSNTEDILSTQNGKILDRIFTGYDHQIMAGGHTHIQMLIQHKGKYIINPGSVGLPFKEFVGGGPPTIMKYAEYCIIRVQGQNIDINLKRISYDLNPLLETITNSDNPLKEILLQQYR